MTLRGYRYGACPGGDHTMVGEGGGLRTRSADAYNPGSYITFKSQRLPRNYYVVLFGVYQNP